MPDEETGADPGQVPATAQTPANLDPQTLAQNPAPAQNANPEGQDPDGEDFNADRARALIRKLRDEAKQATRQLRDLDTLRAQVKAAEDAKLSDEQRLSKRAADLEAELAQERQIAQDRTNRYEVQLLASRIGIVDPDAAVKLLDWSSLDYAEDGRPQDIEAALRQLIEDRPYLARQTDERPRQAQGSPTNPATRTTPPGSRRYTATEIADRAFWNANKADIMAAFREGRIDN